MFGRKKQQEQQDKEVLVNFAFDRFLKEGEDYTVVVRAGSMVLVKKIVRWAYFNRSEHDAQALFSIETDKGLFCFQLRGKVLMRIQADACTSFYPMLKS